MSNNWNLERVKKIVDYRELPPGDVGNIEDDTIEQEALLLIFALTEGMIEIVLGEKEYDQFLDFLDKCFTDSFLLALPLLERGGHVWFKYIFHRSDEGELILDCPPEIAIPIEESDTSVPEEWSKLPIFYATSEGE